MPAAAILDRIGDQVRARARLGREEGRWLLTDAPLLELAALASEARMAMPPDSWAGRAMSAAPRPTLRRASSAAARASRLAVPASSRGRATLSRADSQGARVCDWKTTEVSPLPAARVTAPRVGASSPASSRSAVDLPQPEGPTRATISPGARVRSTGPRARPRA